MKTWQKLQQNPALWARYKVRELVLDGIRTFFKERAFSEFETPLLARSPGTEPFLEVFATTLQTQGNKTQPAFLLTSPEYALKKLVAAGGGNCFEICKSFRNGEGVAGTHSPEFTILEWYHVQADYTDVMTDFEQLMQFLVKKIQDKSTLTYQGRTFDLSSPYPRITVAEAFEKYVGINDVELFDREALAKVAVAKKYEVTAETTWEQLYDQLLLNEIEPELARYDTPVILKEYPASQAALSKRKASDPRFAERFEVYIGGIELGNAFTELTDAQEQRTRFEADLALRRTLGKVPYEMDEDYLAALASLPPTGGIAVGVDRLVMLLADAASIEETLFFPFADLFEFESNPQTPSDKTAGVV
jgi:lysyl-tRNA synthetase class 2